MERRRKGRPVGPDARLGLPDFHPSTRSSGACWEPRGASQGDGGWELAVARLAARGSSSHRRDWSVWPWAYIGFDGNVYLLTMQGPPARAPALPPSLRSGSIRGYYRGDPPALALSVRLELAHSVESTCVPAPPGRTCATAKKSQPLGMTGFSKRTKCQEPTLVQRVIASRRSRFRGRGGTLS